VDDEQEDCLARLANMHGSNFFAPTRVAAALAATTTVTMTPPTMTTTTTTMMMIWIAAHGRARNQARSILTPV